MKYSSSKPLRFASGFRHVLLIVALLFTCIAAAQQAPPEGPVSTGPDRVIRHFYRWYVQMLNASKDPFAEPAQLKTYVTDRLLREIEKKSKIEGGIGSDPFIDAQDFDKEWAKNIVVSTPAVTGDRATAEVQLKGKEFSHKLLVTLIQEQGNWKIDKVAGQ